MHPVISIIMPSYNAEKYLREAMDSILTQSFQDFEFLIINDGSTDSTEEIILSYSDSRINYVKNETNIKLIASLNKGFKLAKGKYITRMDADDISLPERLEKQVNFMEKHPEIGISGGQMEIFGSAIGDTDYPLSHDKCIVRLLDQTCFSNNLFIIRNELVKKHNFQFNKEYLHVEDYKFYTDVLQKIKGANLPDILTKYRKHDDSVTSVYFPVAFKNRHMVRVEHLMKLTDFSKEKAEQFYDRLSFSRLRSIKSVRKLLIEKYKEEENYLNKVIFDRIWYKDALYEVENSLKGVFSYSLIYLIQFNKTTILNGVNVLKHYVKYKRIKNE